MTSSEQHYHLYLAGGTIATRAGRLDVAALARLAPTGCTGETIGPWHSETMSLADWGGLARQVDGQRAIIACGSDALPFGAALVANLCRPETALVFVASLAPMEASCYRGRELLATARQLLGGLTGGAYLVTADTGGNLAISTWHGRDEAGRLVTDRPGGASAPCRRLGDAAIAVPILTATPQAASEPPLPAAPALILRAYHSGTCDPRLGSGRTNDLWLWPGPRIPYYPSQHALAAAGALSLPAVTLPAAWGVLACCYAGADRQANRALAQLRLAELANSAP